MDLTVPSGNQLRQMCNDAYVSLAIAAAHIHTGTVRLSRLKRSLLHHHELAASYHHWLSTRLAVAS